MDLRSPAAAGGTVASRRRGRLEMGLDGIRRH